MDWATKKFHYKIIKQNGEVIACVYKLLTELEDFAKKSDFVIKKLERKGPDRFVVEVITNQGWRM